MWGPPWSWSGWSCKVRKEKINTNVSPEILRWRRRMAWLAFRRCLSNLATTLLMSASADSLSTGTTSMSGPRTRWWTRRALASSTCGSMMASSWPSASPASDSSAECPAWWSTADGYRNNISFDPGVFSHIGPPYKPTRLLRIAHMYPARETFDKQLQNYLIHTKDFPGCTGTNCIWILHLWYLRWYSLGWMS